MSEGFRRDTAMWAAPTHGAELPDLGDPLEDYHEASSLYATTMLAQGGPAEMLYASTFNPEQNLGKPTTPYGSGVMALPPPAPVSTHLIEALHRRRSTVELDGSRRVPLDQLAALLVHSYGLRAPQPEGAVQTARVSPSAGAMYPLDILFVAQRVQDLPPGVYHFNPFSNTVARMGESGPVDELPRHVVMPELVELAGCVFFITASIWRSRSKYGTRSYRYVLLEAGHVAQNLLLVAASLGMGEVPWGGFYDRSLNRYLGLDGLANMVLYAVSVDGAPE